MKEMLLVGRGGEGVVLASQLAADTLARAGYSVQSFPEFKAERRGAPISAFVRWDAAGRIHRRYKLQACDVLGVISPSPPAPAALAAVRPGGLVVLNRADRFPYRGAFEVARVPASRIAAEHGILSAEGRAMGNVALLGALVRLLEPDALPSLEEAIRARMGALAEPNVRAARAGYARCIRQHRLASDAAPEAVPPLVRAPLSRFPVSTTDSRGIRTGGWSLDRPLLRAACTACGVCALFCPEGAIDRVGGVMTIDYDHCKGCGICEVVCPVRGALELEAV